MPIITPTTTIVSAEDPAVYRQVATELTATSNGLVAADTGVFTTTTGNQAVVDVSASSGDVTSSGVTNITFATGANKSVVLAGLTTSEINTAVLSSAMVYNTDKDIFITGIDQSTTQQYTVGGAETYVLPPATDSTLGGIKVGSGLSVTGDGTLSATGGGGGSGTVTSVGITVPSGFNVSNSPITTSGNIAISTTLSGVIKGNGSGFTAAVAGTDYQSPITLTTLGTSGVSTFSANTLNIPQYQSELTLTTTGSSGAATLIGSTLNIPQYSGAGGTVTSVGLSAGDGISVSGGPITSSGTITVTNTGVTSITGGTDISVTTSTGSVTINSLYTLPTASTSTLGGVKVDGTSIIINAGVITAVGGGGGSGVASIGMSGGTTGLTFDPATPITTSGSFTMTGTLGVANGGTGLSPTLSDANKILQVNSSGNGYQYATASSGTVTSVGLSVPTGFSVSGSPVTGSGTLTISTTLSGIVKGNGSGLVAATAGTDYQSPITLTTTGSSGAATLIGNTLNIPQYSSGASGVSSFSAGTTGLTPSSASTGTVTLAGTLNIANGGTGATTAQAAMNALAGGVTANRVLRANGTNVTLSQVVLTTDVSGTLPAANGGTGLTPAVGDANKLLQVNSSGNGYQYTTAGSGTVTSVGLSVPTGFSVTGSPVTGAGTLTITTSLSGIVKGNGSGLVAATAGTDYQAPITLTTTGSSGAATLIGNTLNIPQYSGGAAAGVSSFSAGTTGLTPSSASTGTVTLAGTLNIANGGTGQTTKTAAFDALAPTTTAGDLIYYNGTDNVRLAVGTTGQVLTVSGGAPAWGAAGSGTVTTASVVTANGFAGTVANATTTPAITLTTSVSGMVKGNGTALSAATAGTDYAAPTTATSSQLLAGDGTGGFTNITLGTNLSLSGTTLNASGGGGGAANVEQVVLRYGTDQSFQTSTSGGLVRQTSGVSCTITNALTCAITLTFTGYTTPPKSLLYYSQSVTTNNFRIIPVPSAASYTIVGGGTASNPDLANLTSFSSTNVISLQPTYAATSAAGTQPYLVIVIGF